MELIPAAMTILDVCAYLGLAAVGTATINMLLGLLIALRYSPVRLWPHRRINIFRLHNWTAYLVLVLILVHPAVLLLRRSTRFGWSDLVLPIHSPVQPTLNRLEQPRCTRCSSSSSLPCCGCTCRARYGASCTTWYFRRWS
jgi:predicted ferric reductase